LLPLDALKQFKVKKKFISFVSVAKDFSGLNLAINCQNKKH
jgi:hypothetical protein